MADNTTYLATEGDRWDIVAFRAYGDPMRMNELMDANKNVALSPTIPAGTVLNIPVLDEPDLNTSLLPPWKRP